VIRVDAVWLAVEPLDMRAGTETALARVVRVFREARAHHVYLFTNRRTTRSRGSGCASDDCIKDDSFGQTPDPSRD
jgi:transposase